MLAAVVERERVEMISRRTAGKLLQSFYQILESLAALLIAFEFWTDNLEKAAAYGVFAVYFHLCARQIERGERKWGGAKAWPGESSSP